MESGIDTYRHSVQLQLQQHVWGLGFTWFTWFRVYVLGAGRSACCPANHLPLCHVRGGAYRGVNPGVPPGYPKPLVWVPGGSIPL